MAKSKRVAARRARVEILRNQGKTRKEIAAELNCSLDCIIHDIRVLTPKSYDERVLAFYRANPGAKISTAARRLGLNVNTVGFATERLRRRGLWASQNDRMDEAVMYFRRNPKKTRVEVARLFSVNPRALGVRLIKIGIRCDFSKRRGGKTLEELARDWGTTKGAARNYCNRHGLKYYHTGWRRVVEFYRENPGLSRRELALTLGESMNTVRRACRLGGIDPPQKVEKDDYSTVAPALIDKVMNFDARLPPKWLRDELLFCVEPIRLPPAYMRRYIEIYKRVKNDKSEFGRARLGFKGGENG